MHTITILGLGPGDLDDLTIGALRTLQAAEHVVLRTSRHPCIAALLPLLAPNCRVESCDDLYEQHAEFADVYAAVVARVLAAAEHDDVVYAVPGHPWVGEATTPRLLAQAQEYGAEVTIVGGMSFVAPAFAAAGVDLMDGSQICDAMLLARQHYPQVETLLLAAYPPDHEVVVLRGAGTATQAVERMPLEELDRSDRFDHLTSVYVPPLAAYGSFSALLELVAHLRAPEGCPWDREQTLESLRQDLLDEAAEVMEAIDLEVDGRDNSRHIAEELGDLYLVASMLTQIATEEGRFQIGDVMRGVVTKLIRRHPHVFSDVEVSGVDNVLTNWDAIKAQEKAEQGLAPHPLDGVPAALPALEKARKLQSKAAKLGWLDRSALAGADPNLAAAVGPALDEARLGALLWQLVAIAHRHDLNAENALRSYTAHYRETAHAPQASE
jgi:tetrapyrrole methylase family protein/MazG family protein